MGTALMLGSRRLSCYRSPVVFCSPYRLPSPSFVSTWLLGFLGPGFGGSTWPDAGMTLEENLADLQRHAEDFAQRSGFTYTVLASGSGRIIGCVYIYPSGSADGTADVRSWVRADQADLDTALHDAVSTWLNDAWPFTAIRYAARLSALAG
jgi:hypothetical protein